jgi:hypothetical protein
MRQASHYNQVRQSFKNMLKEIELSILNQLQPVRELLQPGGVLVRGLPDDTERMKQETAGDVVVFINGGNINSVSIEVNVLLPSRVKTATACFPVVERVWGLLHLFLPDYAAGVLTNMEWQLMVQDTRWLAKIEYKASISPYAFDFPDDDTLPGIDTILMSPITPPAPSFFVTNLTSP